MRLLIAAGGTGGHIYPALAVARSLSADPEAPELRWLGGHRGLEASLVPAAGIPLRRLAARSLRTTDLDVHAVLDPIRLAVVRPAGHRDPGRGSGRPPSSRPAGTSPSPSCWPPPRCASRSSCGTATSSRAARCAPRHGSPTRWRCRSTPPAGRSPRPRRGRPCYVTGTPIRDVSADRPRGRPGPHGRGPGERVLLIFGGSQAVRRFNAAVAERPAAPGRAGDRHPRHRRRGLRDRAGRPRGPARGGPPAVPAVPVPARRDAGRAGRRRPRRRAGRVLDAGRGDGARRCRWSSCPYPHAAGHQRANAASLVERRRRPPDRRRGVRRRRAARRGRRCSTTRCAHAAMSAAARSLGAPGAADAVAELVLAAAARAPFPDAAGIERLARGPAA